MPSRAYCSGYSDVVRQLKKHVPAYDKSDLDFAAFAGGVREAIRRAKALDPSGEAYKQNPSTSVWRLVEKIVELP